MKATVARLAPPSARFSLANAASGDDEWLAIDGARTDARTVEQGLHLLQVGTGDRARFARVVDVDAPDAVVVALPERVVEVPPPVAVPAAQTAAPVPPPGHARPPMPSNVRPITLKAPTPPPRRSSAPSPRKP